MSAPKIVLSVTVLAVVATATVATTTGSQASAPKPASTSTAPFTPNDCVRRNGGDYNACNVGNSGRGDLPYQTVGPRLPETSAARGARQLIAR